MADIWSRHTHRQRNGRILGVYKADISPKRSSLSSLRASLLSFLSCRSISWLIRFCSIASSLRQHAMMDGWMGWLLPYYRWCVWSCRLLQLAPHHHQPGRCCLRLRSLTRSLVQAHDRPSLLAVIHRTRRLRMASTSDRNAVEIMSQYCRRHSNKTLGVVNRKPNKIAVPPYEITPIDLCAIYPSDNFHFMYYLIRNKY